MIRIGIARRQVCVAMQMNNLIAIVQMPLDNLQVGLVMRFPVSMRGEDEDFHKIELERAGRGRLEILVDYIFRAVIFA